MARAARIKNQLGVQSAFGTPVAPTVQLPGLIQLKHAPNRVLREEYRASWGGSNTHDDLSILNTGSYIGRCTTTTLPVWLAGSVRGDVTPTTLAGIARQWKYDQWLSPGPIPDPKMYTLYAGDDDGGGGGGPQRAADNIITKIVIEGSDDSAMTIRCDLLGTGIIAIGPGFIETPTVKNETAKNLLNCIFIKPTWAALDAVTRGTQAAPGDELRNLAYGFTWTWDSGMTSDFNMSGQLTRIDLHRPIPTVTLQLRLKWTSAAAAEGINSINNTRRMIRLENQGSLIVGSNYNMIRIDGAYDSMPMEALTSQENGTNRATWDLIGVEDTSRKCEVTVINTLNALGSAPA